MIYLPDKDTIIAIEIFESNFVIKDNDIFVSEFSQLLKTIQTSQQFV